MKNTGGGRAGGIGRHNGAVRTVTGFSQFKSEPFPRPCILIGEMILESELLNNNLKEVL